MSQDAQSIVMASFMCFSKIVMLTKMLHDVRVLFHSLLHSQMSVCGSSQQFCFMTFDPFKHTLSRLVSAAETEKGACPVLMMYDRNPASRALFAKDLSRTTGSTSMTPVRLGSVKMILAI